MSTEMFSARVTCRVCGAGPKQWCRYTGGTDAGRAMSLFHATRRADARAAADAEAAA